MREKQKERWTKNLSTKSPLAIAGSPTVSGSSGGSPLRHEAELSKRRRTPLLVLGAVFTAILLSGGVASAEKRSLSAQTTQSVSFDHQTVPTGNVPIQPKLFDGKIAVANNSGGISIATRNSEGTYLPTQEHPVGSSPNALTPINANPNQDSKLDIAAINQGSGDMSLLLDDGAGSYLPELRITPTTPIGVLKGIDRGYFNKNNDNKEGLVVGGFEGFTVWNSNSEGDFQEAGSVSMDGLTSIEATSLNESVDSNTDVVAPRIEIGDHPSEVLAWLGDGANGFQQVRVVTSTSGEDFVKTAVGQYNSGVDSLPDIAAISQGQGSNEDNLRLLLNNGDGTYTESVKPLGPNSDASDVKAVEIKGQRDIVKSCGSKISPKTWCTFPSSNRTEMPTQQRRREGYTDAQRTPR